MHYIDVTHKPDGGANCQWTLQKQILGSVPVKAETVDHKGEVF